MLVFVLLLMLFFLIFVVLLLVSLIRAILKKPVKRFLLSALGCFIASIACFLGFGFTHVPTETIPSVVSKNIAEQPVVAEIEEKTKPKPEPAPNPEPMSKSEPEPVQEKEITSPELEAVRNKDIDKEIGWGSVASAERIVEKPKEKETKEEEKGKPSNDNTPETDSRDELDKTLGWESPTGVKRIDENTELKSGLNAHSTSSAASSYSRANNFNLYDNPDQQNTNSLVLNTKTMKIHYPTCNDVKKIAPENYATTTKSEEELKSEGYTLCGHCHD